MFEDIGVTKVILDVFVVLMRIWEAISKRVFFIHQCLKSHKFLESLLFEPDLQTIAILLEFTILEFNFEIFNAGVISIVIISEFLLLLNKMAKLNS